VVALNACQSERACAKCVPKSSIATASAQVRRVYGRVLKTARGRELPRGFELRQTQAVMRENYSICRQPTTRLRFLGRTTVSLSDLVSLSGADSG
jgi:hypothetical protein